MIVAGSVVVHISAGSVGRRSHGRMTAAATDDVGTSEFDGHAIFRLSIEPTSRTEAESLRHPLGGEAVRDLDGPKDSSRNKTRAARFGCLCRSL